MPEDGMNITECRRFAEELTFEVVAMKQAAMEDHARLLSRIAELEAAIRDRAERIAEVEKLGRLQWGCAGEHRGNGTPDCPKFMHHHHDERCIPGLRNRLKAAEVENVRLNEEIQRLLKCQK